MVIKFKRIRLHNFFSFVDAELDLNDMGYTLVEGRNYCKLDSAYSNGSGKSSIFNGICYALTGETAQGISNGVENIFSNPDDCWVELTFNVDEDEFVLKRFKTPRTDLKIYINGEDKSGKGVRESSKLLATYIPDLTSTLVNSIIILGQGLPNRFTDNNPAARKDILEKLTKSDFMIQSIKDKLDVRQTELRADLRVKEDLSLSTNSQLDVYKEQLKSLKNDLEDYKEFSNSEDGIDIKIKTINTEISNIDLELNDLVAKLDTCNSSIEDLNKKHNEVLLEAAEELDKVIKPIEEQIEDRTLHLSEIKSDIKSLQKEINKLKNITDICPTCGQKIPNVIKPDTTNLEKELIVLKSNESVTQEKLDSLIEQKKNDIQYLNEQRSNKVYQIGNQIKEKKEEMSDLSKKRSSLISKKETLTEQLYKLTNLKMNYDKLLKSIDEVTAIIDKLNGDIVKIGGDIVIIKEHLNIVQQMITLSKREFRGILLLNIIEYINKKVKQYSYEVFGTDKLNFELDENSIDIAYCDKPYENLSGGEKQKIDVIVQLALRDILSKQLNIHSNLLVCDEIFDNLDSQGCSKIMNLISNLNDIDSVFIVSHHAQDLELTKDNSVIVEKNEDGLSTIKIV